MSSNHDSVSIYMVDVEPPKDLPINLMESALEKIFIRQKLQYEKRRKMAIISSLAILFFLFTIGIAIGSSLIALGTSAPHLCEGLVLYEKNYKSPFNLVTNCESSSPATFLKSPTFCVNCVTNQCFDITKTAFVRQIVGLFLTVLSIVFSIALIISFIFCAKRK